MPNTSGLPFGYPAAQRSKLRLNVGWRFHLGDRPKATQAAEAAQADYDDANWELVNVPHTLKLTSLDLDGCDDDKTQPTFHREVGWYRRTFTVDADPARKVFLEFEGAHQVTDAWVNGQHVGAMLLRMRGWANRCPVCGQKCFIYLSASGLIS